jgi:hypothetical protein
MSGTHAIERYQANYRAEQFAPWSAGLVCRWGRYHPHNWGTFAQIGWTASVAWDVRLCHYIQSWMARRWSPGIARQGSLSQAINR